MATVNPRRALVAISLATGLSLLGDTTLYTVLPTHTAVAGVLVGDVGILLSANRFIRLALNGPVGVVVDRWPRRRIFVPAVFLGAVSTALYALDQGYWPLLLGRLLWGLAWVGIWIGGNAIVLDISQADNRGRWVGRYHVSFYLGAAAGSGLGGFLTDLLGYHWAMGVAAGLALFGALFAWLFLPETALLRGELRARQPAEPTRTPGRPRAQMRTAMTAAVALLGVNRLVMAGILFATFNLFLAQRLGETVIIAGRQVGVATLTGLALGASTLISTLSAPLAGRLTDRLGERWRVAAGSLLSGAVGFVLVAVGTPLTILLGLPLTSAASGSNQGLSTALTGDLSGRSRQGRQLGVLFTVGDLTSAIGPPLAYNLNKFVSLEMIYLFSAGLLGLVFLLVLSLALRQGHGQLLEPVI
ncbi:MAG: MFS transporter [Chloroflexi bacterium]|nr:MFS transporter [Chloroflexota bacterium]MCI0575533.1 MFS transporter [Chloroflexota bacterium]MCI0644310.1 MFS transporter [Chloroflexota bacterium]MCI0726293.1 MFS transporter [Chloroflexota bacterium]